MHCLRIVRHVGLLSILATVACVSVRLPSPFGGSRCATGQAQLWEDRGFRGRRLTIYHSRDHAKLGEVTADNGDRGFNDKASSARWTIPVGCKLVLYSDTDFDDERFELVGSGTQEQNADFGTFSDEASSARWEER